MRHLVAFTLFAFTSFANAADLRLGLAAPTTSMDPHFYNSGPNRIVREHIFEALTRRDANAQLTPGLAASWKPIDDATWEFKLRPGALFQDGVALTPDDIVFSFARAPNVPNSPGGFGSSLRAVRSVEIVDAATIRVHTKAPSPNLPGDLGAVMIVSRHVGQAAVTDDYNSGKAAIGTGPYRLVRYVNGDRIELARNDAWWGPKPDWDRVVIRYIPNPGSRTAAILSGDVDIIDFLSPSDLPRLKADPKLSVVSIASLRSVFLLPDYSNVGPTPFVFANDGRKLPKNPLRDLSVRQALSAAINRQAIADRVMQGTAVATGQWMPPGAFGYAPSVTVPVYDPARAKALLAQAGYPHGFRITIHGASDRIPGGPETMQAIAQMWSRVGVKTDVATLPFAAFAARASRQEFSMHLGSWGSGTGEAGNGLINLIETNDPKAGRGTFNRGRYSNPALDALADRALAIFDDAAREKMLIQAVEMATADLPVIPIQQLINFWAVRKGITYEPRVDEATLAIGARLVR